MMALRGEIPVAVVEPPEEPTETMGIDAMTGELVHIHQFEGRDWCVECGWPWWPTERHLTMGEELRG